VSRIVGYILLVDPTTLLRQAERLQGYAAMGGFLITLDQARRGVLEADEEIRLGRLPTLAQTLIEVRQSRQVSARANAGSFPPGALAEV